MIESSLCDNRLDSLFGLVVSLNFSPVLHLQGAEGPSAHAACPLDSEKNGIGRDQFCPLSSPSFRPQLSRTSVVLCIIRFSLWSESLVSQVGRGQVLLGFARVELPTQPTPEDSG